MCVPFVSNHLHPLIIDRPIDTSSVSYCAPPSAILIQQFDISYIAANDSVVFNVTAASVVCAPIKPVPRTLRKHLHNRRNLI